MGFYPFAATIGNLVPPLPVVDGGTGAITAAAGLTALGGLVKQAATPAAGYVMINGTGNIITWTAPNDGVNHRAIAFINLEVTSLETGGQITLSITPPSGSTYVPIVNAGGFGTGLQTYTYTAIMKANTALTLAQASALTGGAAVVYAEIWAL